MKKTYMIPTATVENIVLHTAIAAASDGSAGYVVDPDDSNKHENGDITKEDGSSGGLNMHAKHNAWDEWED